MTRNPETTEAARVVAAIEAELAVTGEVSCAGYTVDDDGCYVFNLARRIRSVLAVSPAVTEREEGRYDDAQAWKDNYDGLFVRWAECDAERLALKDLVRSLEIRLRIATAPAVTEGEREPCDHPYCGPLRCERYDDLAPSPAVTAAEDETPLSPEQEAARQAVLTDPVAMGQIADELRALWKAALEREGNLASAVADVIWKATQYGETEDGDTYAYIVPKGCMHRLVGVAQSNGAHVPVAFRAAPVVAAVPAERCRECGHDLADNDHADWCTGRFIRPAVPADPMTESQAPCVGRCPVGTDCTKFGCWELRMTPDPDPAAAVPEALSEDEQNAYLRGWRDGQDDAAAAVPEAQDGREAWVADVVAALDAATTITQRALITGRPEALNFSNHDRLIASAPSAAVREGERERALRDALAAIVACDTVPDAPRSEYVQGRVDGYARATRAIQALAAPSLAAPEGTEQ